jgi:hypothetical protein
MAGKFTINPFTSKLDYYLDPTEAIAHVDLSDMPDAGGTNTDHDARYYTEAEVDAAFLKLDQTSPQTIINGKPTIQEGLYIGLTSWIQFDGAFQKSYGDFNFQDAIRAGAAAIGLGTTGLKLGSDIYGGSENIWLHFDIANSKTYGDPNFQNEITINGVTSPFLTVETDPLSLHLDQTSPQTVSGGVPISNSGWTIGDGATAQARLTFSLKDDASNSYSVIKLNNLRTGLSEITVDGVVGIPSGFFKASTALANNVIGYTLVSDANNGRTILGTGYDGENYRRFRLFSSGDMWWGSGSATQDVFLVRTTDGLSKPILKLQNSFLVNPGDSTNSQIALKVSTNTAQTRVGTFYVAPNAGYLTANANFDGTNWQRDDTSITSVVYSLDAGSATVLGRFRYAAAGANPATLSTSWQVNTGGVFQVPKLGAISDSTTAMQFFKADGTTAVVTIDTTNSRVGIGKTPAVALDVVGGITTSTTFTGQSLSCTSASDASVWSIRSGGASTRLEGGASAGYFGTYSNHPLIIQTNNTERARIDTSGNLGLGVTPSYFFHGKKDQAAATYFYLDNQNASGIAGFIVKSDSGGVSFQSCGSTSGGIVGASFAGWGRFRSDSSLNGFAIITGGSKPLGFFTNDTERARFLGTGELGLGTTTPLSPVHLEFTDSATDDLYNMFRIRRVSSGTVANEFGAGILFDLEDAAGTARNAARIHTRWVDATNLYPRIGLDIRVSGSLVEQVNLQDGKLVPTTDSDIDLGDSTHYYKDTYSDRFISQTVTASSAGPTDNFNVAGANVVLVDTSSNDVTIGGFVGGVAGQVLYVVRTSTTNKAKLEYNEGTGNQDIFLKSEGDEELEVYGGWVLVCNGTNWYECVNNK